MVHIDKWLSCIGFFKMNVSNCTNSTITPTCRSWASLNLHVELDLNGHARVFEPWVGDEGVDVSALHRVRPAVDLRSAAIGPGSLDVANLRPRQ
jgi:hypothetical protein